MSIVSRRNLNLSLKGDYEQAKSLFGKMELFPQISKTLESSRKKGVQLSAGAEAERLPREDGLFVREILRQGGNYEVLGEFNVRTPSQSLTMAVDLYAKNGEELELLKKGEPVFSFGGTQKVEAGNSIPENLGGGREIVAVLTGSQIIKPMQGAVLTVVKEDLGALEAGKALLAEIYVEDPRSKRVPMSDHIYICYNRKVLAKETEDYFVPKNGSSDFYIPLKGKAYFKNSTDFFDQAVPPDRAGESGAAETVKSQLFLFARGAGGGRIPYGNTPENFAAAFRPIEEMNDKGLVVRRGFEWDFGETAWAGKSPFSVSEASDWEFSLVLIYRLRSGDEPHSMIIRSYSTPAYDAVRIPFMRIYWGCLLRDTLITLADGSTRKIQELLPGDSLQSEKGCLTVQNLIEGHEDRGVLQVKTKGQSLYVSEAHPFVTDQGILTALELLEHPDALLGTQSGPAKAESVTRFLLEEDRVYNLVLKREDGEPLKEADASFYANGILVGDNGMQRLAIEQRTEKKREAVGLTGSWRQDVEHAAEYYKIYNEDTILWKD